MVSREVHAGAPRLRARRGLGCTAAYGGRPGCRNPGLVQRAGRCADLCWPNRLRHRRARSAPPVQGGAAVGAHKNRQEVDSPDGNSTAARSTRYLGRKCAPARRGLSAGPALLTEGPARVSEGHCSLRGGLAARASSVRLRGRSSGPQLSPTGDITGRPRIWSMHETPPRAPRRRPGAGAYGIGAAALTLWRERQGAARGQAAAVCGGHAGFGALRCESELSGLCLPVRADWRKMGAGRGGPGPG